MVNDLSTRATRLLCAAGIAAAAAFGTAMGASDAYADKVSDKQAEAQNALAQLNAMQERLDRASADYGEALAAQEAAEAQRDDASARIEELSGEIDSVQSRLNDRARSMYRGGPTSFLDLLLGSASFSEFTSNWDLLSRVNESDADLVRQSKELRAEASEQERIFSEQADEAARQAAEAAAIASEAQVTVSAMQQTYDGLSAEVRDLIDEQRASEQATAQAAVEAAGAPAPSEASNNGGGSSSEGGNSQPAPAPAPSNPSPQPAPSNGGGSVLDRAYSQLGKPYAWQASGMASFDCSGFVGYALTGSTSRIGSTYTFMSWPRVSDPQPGDVCTNWEHCGIYVGGGQMIHAATYGVGVVVGPVQPGMIYVRP